MGCVRDREEKMTFRDGLGWRKQSREKGEGMREREK